MKVPRPPHRWSVTPRQAIEIQRRLAPRVRRTPLTRPVRLVAGLDMAFSPDGGQCIAGVVLWDLQDRTVVEEHVITRPVRFPYVPGLLSFREAPAVIAALRKLRHGPDCLMCDGHGLAHPRRFGIASHVGVLVDVPTIGCAKSRLTGEHREPAVRRGSSVTLRDGGEPIGTVLRTRDGVKPVYVSIGHRIDLPGAERVVLACAVGYRIPEPTRLADQLVARAKREWPATPGKRLARVHHR
jgi:deoxyribonuclease V